MNMIYSNMSSEQVPALVGTSFHHGREYCAPAFFVERVGRLGHLVELRSQSLRVGPDEAASGDCVMTIH
jgi:hypothetical protein